MSFKGPYLRLKDNQPFSLIVIEVTDGQAPQFYEKSLGPEATYHAFGIQENDVIYAINRDINQHLMYIRLSDDYYEVSEDKLRKIVVDLKNTHVNLSGRSIPEKIRSYQFDTINHDISFSQIEYCHLPTEQIEQELKSALMPKEVIKAPPVQNDYSLNALTHDMILTATQQVVLQKLEPLWFFNKINVKYIADACRIIFCQHPENADVGLELDNLPTQFRQEFCWPENIARHFRENENFFISDVMKFTYCLVNKVYTLHTNDKTLLTPTLPISANQTVSEFLTPLQNENHAGDFDVGSDLQSAILASFSHPNALAPQQHEEGSILDISENYDQLKMFIHNDLYPPAQLSWIGRWFEWICHLCRILDIYCLRITNVAKTIFGYQALLPNKKNDYNSRFFQSFGNFDDNIRDLYVSQLWRGRG